MPDSEAIVLGLLILGSGSLSKTEPEPVDPVADEEPEPESDFEEDPEIEEEPGFEEEKPVHPSEHPDIVEVVPTHDYDAEFSIIDIDENTVEIRSTTENTLNYIIAEWRGRGYVYTEGWAIYENVELDGEPKLYFDDPTRSWSTIRAYSGWYRWYAIMRKPLNIA